MDLLEKVKLNDNTKLTLIPMGTRRQERSFTMSVLAEVPYVELEEVLLNIDNISKIQHLSYSGEILTTYTDCISLKRLSKEIGAYMGEEDTKDVYVIELSTDANLAALRAVQKENIELKEQVATLRETVDYLVLSQLDIPLEEPREQEESEVEADV